MGIADDVSRGIETVVADASQIAASLLHRAHAADAPPALEFDDGGWAHGDGVAVFRYFPSSPGSRDVPIDGAYHETRKQQALAPGLDHVEAVVWHYTDTRACGASALARRLLAVDNARAASWHACVDGAGLIAQSVSAKCGSWHAGGSSAALFVRDQQGNWTMLTKPQRGQVRGYGANSFAYGVELENAGELKLVDGRWCSWPFAFGTTYGAPIVVPEVEVVRTSSAHGWHAFTDLQAAGAQRLLAGLAGRYGLRRAACTLTHAQIDPDNRVDPGPAWTGDPKLGIVGRLPAILDAVFGAS